MLAKQTDTQEQSDSIDTTLDSDTGVKDEIVTVICTILSFILGVICGLITYHCASSLLKRRAAANREQQTTVSLNIDESGNLKRVHYKKSVKADPEPSLVYDEVTPHYSRPGMHNMQMNVGENIAYGQL